MIPELKKRVYFVLNQGKSIAKSSFIQKYLKIGLLITAALITGVFAINLISFGGSNNGGSNGSNADTTQIVIPDSPPHPIVDPIESYFQKIDTKRKDVEEYDSITSSQFEKLYKLEEYANFDVEEFNVDVDYSINSLEIILDSLEEHLTTEDSYNKLFIVRSFPDVTKGINRMKEVVDSLDIIIKELEPIKEQ